MTYGSQDNVLLWVQGLGIPKEPFQRVHRITPQRPRKPAPQRNGVARGILILSNKGDIMLDQTVIFVLMLIGCLIGGMVIAEVIWQIMLKLRDRRNKPLVTSD